MTLKSLISLPLAFLASACISKVELVQRPIVFEPVIGSEVRSSSDIDMSVPFPEDKSFGVWAMDSHQAGNYIDDQEICYTDGVWSSESLPFWPL